MVVAMALSWICLNFYNTVSLNVYIPAIAEELAVSTAPLLYMTTVGWVASCFVTIIGGRIIPKIGAKTVLCVSAIAEGVVFAGIGLSRNLLLTQSLIAVSSCLSVLYCQLTSVAIIANWFPRKKGIILGLVTSAIAIVPIVFLPLFSLTIAEQGITAAMCEWAGFIILYGIVGLFWIREYPAQVGLAPDNMPVPVSTSLKKLVIPLNKVNLFIVFMPVTQLILLLGVSQILLHYQFQHYLILIV